MHRSQPPKSPGPRRHSPGTVARITAIWTAALMLDTAPAADEPNGPRWIQRSFVGSTFLLSFLPETTDWIAVEWSDDTVRWHELVNVAAHTTTTAYADLDAKSRPHRFYRLRAPGTDSATSLRRWEARPATAYRFQLDRLSSFPPLHVQADIEVRDGVKTVTGILSDGDPGWFPDVEELFARLEQARLDGSSQVWATYDPILGYPWRCTWDLRSAETGTVDDGALVQYRISNLVLIPR